MRHTSAAQEDLPVHQNPDPMAKLWTIILLIGSLFSPAVAQELIVNGGFETGDFTGWSNPGAGVVNDNAAPHSGLRNARFPTATLSQTFATVPGSRYIFSYFLGHTGANIFNSMTVNLTDGSSPTIVQNLANVGPLAYSQVVFSYVATATSATIRFTSTAVNGAGLGGRFILDDVSFQKVPEVNPAGASLPVFSALILLALRRRRPQLAALPGQS